MEILVFFGIMVVILSIGLPIVMAYVKRTT